MYRRFGSMRNRGFTIAELLVVLVIASILIIGITRMFTRQVKTFSVQDETARMQEQARMAEDLFLKTVQQTGGFAPATGSSGTSLPGGAILAATDHLLAVQYDDPIYTTHTNVIRAEEIVVFAVSKESGTATETVSFDAYFDKNHDGVVDPVNEKFVVQVPLVLSGPPYNLYRFTPNEANPTGALNRDLVAQNVDNFVIRYFDNDGKQIPAKATNMAEPPPYNLKTTTPSKDWRPDVRSLEMALTLRTSRPDPDYSDSRIFAAGTVATYDASGTASTNAVTLTDNHRRREYISLITPRNLPVAPCGRMVVEANPASPVCPDGSTIKARITDRYGNPYSGGKPVKFSLPGGAGSNALIGPSLTGGAGTGQTVSVMPNAAGEASASLLYKNTSRSILVSAQTEIDCSDAGGPVNFVLTEAVSVNFMPGPPSKIVFYPGTTGYSSASPLETCLLNETTIVGKTYDYCTNPVAPQAGESVGTYDQDAPGGNFLGKVNNGTAPVNVITSEQDFTVHSPETLAGTAPPRDAKGVISQFFKEAARGAWVSEVTANGFPPPHGGATPVAAGEKIFEIFNRPWPPASIDEIADPIQGPLTPPLNDCPGGTNPGPYVFKVLDCNGIDIYDLTEGTNAADYSVKGVLSNTGAVPPLKNDSVQLGTITGINATQVDPLNLTYTSHQANGEYLLNYAKPTCQFFPPDFPLTPIPVNAIPDIKVSLEQSGATLSFDGTKPWIQGCEECELTITPDTVTTCAGFAKVTLTQCANTYLNKEVVLTILGGTNATWVTRNGNTWTAPALPETQVTVTMVPNPAGGAMATAWLGIGDTVDQGLINVRADSKDLNASGQPIWSCETKAPLTVANKCTNFNAYYTSVDSNGVQSSRMTIASGAPLCAAGINYLYADLTHCKSNSDILYPNGVWVQIRYSPGGDVLDEEYMELTAVPPGQLPATYFNNFTSGLRVLGLQGNNSPTPRNNILEYPSSGKLELVIRQWVDSVNLSDACPLPAPAARLNSPPGNAANNPGDIVSPFTQPLPICFPNAITSGGGAGWNGNIKVHWGDIVVRGMVTTPNKQIEKLNPGAVSNPAVATAGPPQFDGSPFSGNNYSDRFVDMYVGHSQGSNANSGNCVNGVDSGCIEGSPVTPSTLLPGSPGGVYQPYKAAGFGNYFTNITYDKITQMIVTLNYDVMKQLAKNRSSYWISVANDQIWNPSHPNWGVLDVSTVLMDPPNTYYLGEYIFIDTYTTGWTGTAYGEPYLGNVNADPLINADALIPGKLPTHKITGAGGFYTKGIIYIAGNMEFGGLGSTNRAIQAVAAQTPPQKDSRYDHNTAVFEEDDLPIRPNPAEARGNFTLNVHINGALYVDGAYGGSGNPSIFGAITGEQGYAGSGTPEVWYNYTLNETGIRNSICVQCCNISASPATLTLFVGGGSEIVDLYGSTGTLMYQSSNPNIATVTQITNTQYRITPGNTAGNTQIIFADINNCSTVVPVSVQTNCQGYFLSPSGIFPSTAGDFDVGMTQDLKITNGANTYGAGNWIWTVAPANGVVDILPSNTATNIMTARQCGQTTVTASDLSLTCPGPYSVTAMVSSPLTVLTVPAASYNMGSTQDLTLGGTSGAGLDCQPAASCAVLTPNSVRVTMNTAPQTIVTIRDLGHGASCTPITQTFNVTCSTPTPGILLDAPSSNAAQNYYGTFAPMGAATPPGAVNQGTVLGWQVTTNDNDGLGTTTDMIDRVEWTTTPSAGVTGIITPDTSSPFCAFGQNVSGGCNTQDISYWPDRFGAGNTYDLTATVYTKPDACGQTKNASISTNMTLRNCFADTFSTSPVSATYWDAATCSPGGNACNTYSRSISGTTFLLSDTAANVAAPVGGYNPVIFSSANSTNFALASNTPKFETNVDVLSIDRSRVATAKAGLRIEDSSGKYITIFGSAGTNPAEAVVVTINGVIQGGTPVTTLTGTVTYRAVYNGTAATPTVTLYAKSGAVAEFLVGTYNLTGFTGAVKVGPFLSATTLQRNRTVTATFDNWNLCKRNFYQ